MKFKIFLLSFFIFSSFAFAQKKLNYLFQSGTNAYHTFRIPTIVTTKQGTLLAVAEGRKNSWDDAGNIDLVCRRSTDNGHTWSPLSVIWSDKENTCGNPAPVVDYQTGKIYLLSTWNLGTDHEYQIIGGTAKDSRRIYILCSDNDGKTWSSPKEITSAVKKNNWTWYATGPMHGIQLTKGKYKGRLLVSCDHTEKNTNKYFSHTIYSDDHGKTWKLGGITPTDQVNECSVAELSDGSVMLNMRSFDSKVKARKVSISSDGGLSWGAVSIDRFLIDPICQGSLYRYSFGRGKKNILLFSNAANRDKRSNYTLKISYDDGKTWSCSKQIFSSNSGYSDLTKMKNGNIGCLYEAGYTNLAEGIVFTSVRLQDLQNSNK